MFEIYSIAHEEDINNFCYFMLNINAFIFTLALTGSVYYFIRAHLLLSLYLYQYIMYARSERFYMACIIYYSF